MTVARALTDTYTGIAPSSIPGFLAGQSIGAVAAVALIAWLYHPTRSEAHDIAVPHDDQTEPRPQAATLPGEGS